jgi:aminopeptidase YwaD
MRMRISVMVAVCVLVPALIANAVAPVPTTPQQYMRHVEYLASPELEGRLAGSPGDHTASAYAAQFYAEHGLQPGGTDGYFQPFEFPSGVELGQGNVLEWLVHGMSLPVELNTEWVPLPYSRSADVTGPLFFAGYGISAQDSESYDDYAGYDVTGKVVIVLRGEPYAEGQEHFQGKHMSPFADLRYKAHNAKQHGAAGILVVNGPRGVFGGPDDIKPLERMGVFGETPLPFGQMRRDALQGMLDQYGLKLDQLQQQMDEQLKPAVLDMSYVTAHLKVDLVHETSQTRNVIALLPGTERPDEYIIIGAHIDHIGHGELGSLVPAAELAALPEAERVHPGADDNASGVAGTLELARYFAERGGNQRTLVFMNFGAEELGILGSQYFVQHPTCDLSKVVAMINLDMIGRVKDNIITVQGMGSAVEWKGLFDSLGLDSPLRITRFDDMVGGSDYTSFSSAGLPVLNFFSGFHGDYNRPSDKPATINAQGAADVLGLVAGVIDNLDARTAPLTFQKTQAQPGQSGGGMEQLVGNRAKLGTIPDYSYTGEDGMRLADVRQGGPADKAGLKGGDILDSIGGIEVRNAYDMAYALSELKPGAEVVVVVSRNGEKLELKATLE